MGASSAKRQRGFSLLEMVIAVALGTLVLGAAVQLYTQGVSATWAVSQRAEMQQDFRAASGLLDRDISLAGAGLSQGAALALPSTVSPVYGCDQVRCYLGTANSSAEPYPPQGAVPYIYGLIPGQNQGPTINGQTTDAITVVYADPTFYLNCYTATITARTVVTFTTPSPLTCTLPIGISTPQAVNDTVAGLTPGDLVLFSFNPPVLAEVTSVNNGVVTFAYTPDALKMNQTPTGATAGLVTASLNAVATGTRLLVITYYLDNTISPPRLMRQVSGHSPIPVAENVVYMKFSYDLYDPNAGATRADQADGGVSYGLLPNEITKINIKHMSMNSTMKGAKGFQGFDLQTSVSARDLTYNNNYPLAP